MALKQYVGDGVYVELDAQGIVLTTENGEETTNRIVLEPDVWDNLTRYVTKLNASDTITSQE